MMNSQEENRDHESLSSTIMEEMAVEEELHLSSNTLKVLEEFLQEQLIYEGRFHQQATMKLANTSMMKNPLIDFSMDLFKEDWQLSQFWYDDKTTSILAEEILRVTTIGSRIACICAPSIYCKLLKVSS
jgi:EEF1A lysine methyltransferase 1